MAQPTPPITINGIRVWVCDRNHFQIERAATCHCGQPLHRQVFVRPGLPNQEQFAKEWEEAWVRVHTTLGDL